MASHLPLLLLLSLSLSLSLLSGANRILKPSDADALREVIEDFGVNGQPSCLLPGISCERRVSRNFSEIRVTQIVIRSQRLNGFLSPAIGRLSELKELSLPNNVHLFPRRYRFAEENSTSKSNSTQNHTSANAPSATPSKNSTQSSPPAPAPSQTNKHHRKHTKRLVLGSIVSAIAGMLLGLVFPFLFRLLSNCMQGKGKKASLNIFSPMIKRSEDLAFLEKEDGLSSLQIIGRGGCGEVYKAELPGSNGKLIAIKKIIKPTITEDGKSDLNEGDSKLLNKRMRQIRSEIQTVGHIRHRNLLPLLAHVARPDCHYLVYSFLFLLSVSINAEDPYRFFTWNVTFGDIYPLGVKQQGLRLSA